jgi:uncharacterized protein YndB with AHSA1/START domain
MLKTTHAMNQSVTVRRKYEATAEELFDAWLDPQSLAAWMRPGGIERTEAKLDARVGGRFEILMYTVEGPIRHTGVYREIDKPRRLVFTWASPATYLADSVVTVEFLIHKNATELVLTHTALPDDGEAVKSHTGGWGGALEHLAEFVA